MLVQEAPAPETLERRLYRYDIDSYQTLNPEQYNYGIDSYQSGNDYRYIALRASNLKVHPKP